MKNNDTQQLGISVYIHALKKQIEKEVESRYSKRIDYLVGANNELMNSNTLGMTVAPLRVIRWGNSGAKWCR
jgi:hypothetical protein